MRTPALGEAHARVAGAAAAVAAGAFLLGRLAQDVHRKPLFVDEVVAGMTAVLPLGELLRTVVLDRGGSPAHFVLVHAVFAVEASADSLRWTSVACAVAAVLVTYDLGRLLAGRLAGAVAAVAAATSPLLGVYGSFGRMYALFALAAAVAADLLVRALDRPTVGLTAAAAIAAALLPLVHAYGIVPALAFGGALAFRRLRPRRLVALGVLAVVAAVPVVAATSRLADRFGIGREGGAPLLSLSDAVGYSARTIGDLAGGHDIAGAVAVVLAVAGAAVLRASRPAFLAAATVTIVLPFVLLVLIPTGRPQGLANLSSRHMIFMLPLWAALIGVGAAAAARLLRPPLAAAGVVALAAVFVVGTSSGSGDPRTSSGLARVTGARGTLASPAAWLGARTEPGDLLFYGSPVYLEALPGTRHARLLDPAPGGVLGRALDRAAFPVPGTVVAVPHGRADVDRAVLREHLPRRAQTHVSSGWLVVRSRGPYRSERAALESMDAAFAAAAAAVVSPSRRLRSYLESTAGSLCAAVQAHGGRCAET